ncbi:MAG: PP2C family protein-serine/threonine phosphatase [Acidobacteriaceae bacterium]
MTAFQWTPSPSNQPGRDRPLPCAIPHIAGAGLDMQCRGGHDCMAAGDLFDAASPRPGVVLFLLMSVARHSHRPLHLLALAQDVFRMGAQQYAGAANGQTSDGLPPSSAPPSSVLSASMLPDMMRQMQQRLDAAVPLYSATALLASYETATATLTWASAGAPPLLLKDGAKVEAIEGQGGPLGLPSGTAQDRGMPRGVQVRVLAPGTAAVFITPGLVHAASHDTEFGLNGAAAALAAQKTRDPQEMCRALVAAAIRFEQQPGRFGPPLRIPGFRDRLEEDMTAVALLPAI